MKATNEYSGAVIDLVDVTLSREYDVVEDHDELIVTDIKEDLMPETVELLITTAFCENNVPFNVKRDEKRDTINIITKHVILSIYEDGDNPKVVRVGL